MGTLSPSVEVDSQGCASPLILGGPTSPSGSGEGFLFLAVLATGKSQVWKKREINGNVTPKEKPLISKNTPSTQVLHAASNVSPSKGALSLHTTSKVSKLSHGSLPERLQPQTSSCDCINRQVKG